MNKKGNSLIQVLVSIAILSVIIATTARLFDTQNREMRSLNEKLTISEKSTQLANLFQGPNYCSCLLRGRAFNSTDLTLNSPWNPAITFMPSSFTAAPPFPAACTPSIDMLIPAANGLINSSQMRVEAINFENTAAQGSGFYTSNIVVRIQQNSMIRLLNPIRVPIRFQVNSSDPPAAQSFLNCNGSSGTIKKFAFFNPALITVEGTQVLNSGVIDCVTNRVLIEFGGVYSQVGVDRRASLTLNVNGAMVNQVRSGVHADPGTIQESPGTIHGSFLVNCVGNITATTDWENFSHAGLGPRIANSYLTIEFID